MGLTNILVLVVSFGLIAYLFAAIKSGYVS